MCLNQLLFESRVITLANSMVRSCFCLNQLFQNQRMMLALTIVCHCMCLKQLFQDLDFAGPLYDMLFYALESVFHGSGMMRTLSLCYRISYLNLQERS